MLPCNAETLHLGGEHQQCRPDKAAAQQCCCLGRAEQLILLGCVMVLLSRLLPGLCFVLAKQRCRGEVQEQVGASWMLG